MKPHFPDNLTAMSESKLDCYKSLKTLKKNALGTVQPPYTNSDEIASR